MLTSIVLLGFVTAIVFAFLYVNKKRQRLLELAALIPTCKDALPLVGHAYKFMSGGSEKFWGTLLELFENAAAVGGVMAFWIGPSLQIIVNDPDDAITVLNSCFDKHYYYKFGTSWVGQGLVTADAPIWKRNRKLLNPTFSQHVLDGFLMIFNKQSALLAEDLEPFAGAGKFDPREYFTERTLETVCQTAVGISLDDKSVIDQEYKAAVETMLNLLAQRLSNHWLHADLIYGLTSMKKAEKEAVAILHNMSRSVMQKRRAERKEGLSANSSSRRFIAFLDLMLDLAEDGSFSDEQIQFELDTIIVAGHDTSARVLATVILSLGSYPEVQEKVYEEIMTVLGASADVDKEDLARLVYTEAVIKEALRLNPVTPIIGRYVDKEVKLKNYTLPAGCGCIVTLWGINRLPIWGPDRLQFRPERWLQPASLPESPGAYCSFSLGKRNCIGKAYAIMSIKTLVVHLVRKFRIKGDIQNVKRKFDLLLKFAEGHHISLELRQQ